MTISAEGVLLLNATFEPLHIVSWKHVIRLLTAGKVEVVEESDREIRSLSVVFRLPSVVRLLRYVHYRQPLPKLTRANIYARDDFRCAFCGREYEARALSLDHIVPRAQGGKTLWENVVTCCVPCNVKKANRTPAQAHMTLLRQPTRPDRLNSFVLTFGRQLPPSWRNYMPSLR
jgi:5-methylcytosine-specific restriction endonuclease McrA